MAVARALFAAASAGVFGAGAHEAWGAPPSATFSVLRAPGAEECPDATALRARIEQITGTPLATLAATEPPLALEVSFTREGARYRAALRTSGPKAGSACSRTKGPPARRWRKRLG